MAEFEVLGQTYSSRKMDAFKQFHVARKIAPIVAPLMRSAGPLLAPGAAGGVSAAVATLVAGGIDTVVDALSPLISAISEMPAEDCDFVIQNCLAVVNRRQPGGTGWAPIWNVEAKQMMFSDIDMPTMLTITARVLVDNVSSFTFALPSGSTGAGR